MTIAGRSPKVLKTRWLELLAGWWLLLRLGKANYMVGKSSLT